MNTPTEEILHHPHDNLFKAAFQYKETVETFVNTVFPPELRDIIDLNALKLDPTSYISSQMAESFSDVVYRTKQKGGKQNVAMVLLFEHKSKQTKDIYVQLLNYMTAIWLKDIASKKKLSIIIPIIFYHGKRKWQRKSFPEYFEQAPQVIKKFIPQFDYILLEVFQTPDDVIIEMSNEHLLGSLMLQYKKSDDAHFIRNRIKQFFKYFDKHPEKQELLRIFVTYANNGFK